MVRLTRRLVAGSSSASASASLRYSTRQRRNATREVSASVGRAVWKKNPVHKIQKLMILTSTQNKMEYNLIEEALKDQHPTIQDEESRGRRSDRKSDERSSFGSRTTRKPGFSRPTGWKRRTAYAAVSSSSGDSKGRDDDDSDGEDEDEIA